MLFQLFIEFYIKLQIQIFQEYFFQSPDSVMQTQVVFIPQAHLISYEIIWMTDMQKYGGVRLLLQDIICQQANIYVNIRLNIYVNMQQLCWRATW